VHASDEEIERAYAAYLAALSAHYRAVGQPPRETVAAREQVLARYESMPKDGATGISFD
jgi:hypothetical protein